MLSGRGFATSDRTRLRLLCVPRLPRRFHPDPVSPVFDQLDQFLFDLAGRLGMMTIYLNPLLAIVLVGLTCGMVGSLVIGNRMAFFSDAMAHTAFAGIGLALLGIVLAVGATSARQAEPYLWLVPWVTAVVGVAAGLAIVGVRSRTGLSNDTVIGVFFALATGIGGMLLPEVRKQIGLDPDQFLFGSITYTTGSDLFTLFVLTVLTAVVVTLRYNALVFASFNPSLARSRGVPVAVNDYVLVVLLALVVNLSVKVVGVLLINAMLVVPAAAAVNLARNLRQVFWLTVASSVVVGLVGVQLSHRLAIPLRGREPLTFGPSGTIVVVAVGWFFLTMLFARGRAAGRAG